jgi:excisionase family DNA binding protein
MARATKMKPKRGSDARRKQSPAEKRLLTRDQVADMLGFDKRTVDRYATIGELTRIKIGRSTRFREEDVQGLIARGVQAN